MDTSIIVATITGTATIAAAVITVISRSRSKTVEGVRSGVSRVRSNEKVRTVYYRGAQHQFLKFGNLTCRIQSINGGETILVSTNELFHDAEGTDQVSNSNRP